MNADLSAKMWAMLRTLALKPLQAHDRRTTGNALVKRGMAEYKYSVAAGCYLFTITEWGCNRIHASKKQVAVKYAEWFLGRGIQLRHNIKQLVVPNQYIGRTGYTLEHEYYQHPFEMAVEAVYDWQTRAIELARAEIAAMRVN